MSVEFKDHLAECMRHPEWTAEDCITWLYLAGYEEQAARLRDQVHNFTPPGVA